MSHLQRQIWVKSDQFVVGIDLWNLIPPGTDTIAIFPDIAEYRLVFMPTSKIEKGKRMHQVVGIQEE
jgi:hypothetical protein